MPHWHGDRDLRGLPAASGPACRSTRRRWWRRWTLPRSRISASPSIGGDLPIDGSIGARTAALIGALRGRPTERAPRYTADEALAEFFHGGHVGGPAGGRPRDRGPSDRAGDRGVGAGLRRAGFARATSLPRASPSDRALRDGDRRARSSGPRMLGLAASVQPTFDRWWGSRGRLYEQGLGAERAHDEPVPDDARSRGRGGRGSDVTGHAARPDGCARGAARRIMTRPSDCLGPRRSGCTRSGRPGSVIRKTRRAPSRRGCTRTSWPSTPIRSSRRPRKASGRSSPCRSDERSSPGDDCRLVTLSGRTRG